MFVSLAIHHPRDEHREDFLGFMRRVVDATRDAPGLIEFASWSEAGGARLLGLARWESAEAFNAAMPTILSLSGERRPEWTVAPDELLTMETTQ